MRSASYIELSRRLRWLQFKLFLSCLAYSVFWITVSAVLIFLIDVVVLRTRVCLQASAAMPIIGTFILAIVIAALGQTPSLEEVGRLMDRRHDLRCRLETALAMSASPGPVAELQLEDALERLTETGSPKPRIPLKSWLLLRLNLFLASVLILGSLGRWGLEYRVGVRETGGALKSSGDGSEAVAPGSAEGLPVEALGQSFPAAGVESAGEDSRQNPSVDTSPLSKPKTGEDHLGGDQRAEAWRTESDRVQGTEYVSAPRLEVDSNMPRVIEVELAFKRTATAETPPAQGPASRVSRPDHERQSREESGKTAGANSELTAEKASLAGISGRDPRSVGDVRMGDPSDPLDQSDRGPVRVVRGGLPQWEESRIPLAKPSLPPGMRRYVLAYLNEINRF